MLVLSTLTKLLDQVLSENDVHTAILLTPNGELVSFSSSTTRPKDDVRVLVGLSREVWSETRGEEEGMLDSEVGHPSSRHPVSFFPFGANFLQI